MTDNAFAHILYLMTTKTLDEEADSVNDEIGRIIKTLAYYEMLDSALESLATAYLVEDPVEMRIAKIRVKTARKEIANAGSFSL